MVILHRVMPAVAHRAIAVLVPVAAFLVTSQSTSAQDPQERCRAAVVARGPMRGDPTTRFCNYLANDITGSLSAKAWIEPRDVQSSGSGSAAPAGTPAQASAVPTVQPTSLASAALAAVAQDSGANVITAVSINPAMLLSSSSDPDVIARLSRLLDLTIFFPLDGLDQNKDGRLDYAGARMRVNFNATSQSDTLQVMVRKSAKTVVANQLDLVNRIEAVLLKSPKPADCAAALMNDNATTAEIEAGCGAAVNAEIDDAAYIALRKATAAAREAADAENFGLDLRFDLGDPSLGKVRNGAATALVGALGYGRRFNPTATGASAGLRTRLGVRYVSLRDTTLTDFQLDGGLALETARVFESQRLELSAGVEFRYSGKKEAAEILRTRYAEFRGGITVPIAGSTGIALSVSAPLFGDVSPTLSFSGNWQQLLASALGR